MSNYGKGSDFEREFIKAMATKGYLGFRTADLLLRY